MNDEIYSQYRDYLTLKSIRMYKEGDMVRIEARRNNGYYRTFIVSPSGLMYFYRYYGTWRNNG